MREYQYLPQNIKTAVESHLSEGEEIQIFFLAGKPIFSSPDYVFITDKRVLMLDIRTIGHLTASYVNTKTDLPLSKIKSIELNRTFKNKLFGQANLEIDIEDYKYVINRVDCKAAKQALELILSEMKKYS